jgi:thiol-disulfide isomerase/thioredoxin
MSTRTALRRLCVPLTLFASLLIATACTVEDKSSDDDDSSGPGVCGDDEVNSGEQCDGSDLGGASCATAGFDQGTLGCLPDCTFDVNACVLLDADADGLDITAEATYGTDPNNPDTDTDGFWDGDEVNQGSNPLDIASWPYNSGLWPNRLPVAQTDGITGNAFVIGSTVPNLVLTDQFGNPVNLHQFYGYRIMLSFGAVWCGPCQQAAQSSPILWENQKQNGFIILEVLVDTSTPGVPATQNDVTTWANQFGITYPVLFGPGEPFLPAVPTYFMINSDLTVGDKIEGYPGDSTLLYGMTSLY